MLYLLNLGQGCFISQLYKPSVIDNPPICDAEIMEAFHAKKSQIFFSKQRNCVAVHLTEIATAI